MADFRIALETVLDHEGGYKLIEVKGDRGGRTYAGISERANPKWRGWELIDAEMDIDREQQLNDMVDELYRKAYWDPIRGDELKSDNVAIQLFSAAVVCGVSQAVRMMQYVVDAKEDGQLGPETLRRINEEVTGPDGESLDCDLYLLPAFGLQLVKHFNGIVRDDRSQEKFLHGWINRALSDAGEL